MKVELIFEKFFSPDGATLAVALGDSLISMWDVTGAAAVPGHNSQDPLYLSTYYTS